MNTTNILLGTISLLLVVAFAVSFGGFRNDKESDESQVLRQQLQAEITKAEAETEALRLKQPGSFRILRCPALDHPSRSCSANSGFHRTV